jgi:probable F420-dependent oxidoreductase
MRYGIDVAIIGELADPGRVVEIAQAAEAAGWEAMFVWDHLAFAWGVASVDPWVVLAAAAQATTRLRLGTAVTPLPRRRPVVVANTVATLDRLSNGRLVFGAGLGGVPAEYSAFGESEDVQQRGARLDEALTVVTALWSGQVVTHTGTYYSVQSIELAPLPVQRPRVPVWIGGNSRAALRRAARWDGWVGAGDDEQGQMTRSPEQLAGDINYLSECRGAAGAYDVALTGVSSPGDGVPGAYAEAGVTWWLEHIHGRRGTIPELLARVSAGPPSAKGS